ncbi:hypothetical protein KL930_001276 [Ogataea haglerorum]|uniref:Uncharacterized protein n=1 Tax=Ogataea haglerorum TaxID=1937702 RepID=A0AAN6D462_9ASCO|nr:uncharacterized protein KL911_003677 [Ogataea haglerorum]KAG7694953.1 hypothetical protein KL915_003186 [Ogataea haglerorum]KAG7706278.1 hypothetical protein KL914_003173 [Ogataea haglerorum]KAG7708009.1 hypothetical protein KL950_002635 [Ogataea haglerorum]KAG7717193.1 hypothetical protein KL913_002944 [Ogataea haglerorum]KAG7719419.1 hypothetical protein KL949_002411 [Ogataea haglerorum]
MEAPDTTNYHDERGLLKTEDCHIRIRKGQSYEEYLSQKNQYLQEGPIISELETFMENSIRMVNLCSVDSITRVQTIHSLERRYYLGYLDDCLHICNELISKLKLESTDKQERKNYEKLLKQLTDIQDKCLHKLTSILTIDEERKF